MARCWWCGDDPLYVDYHDNEWGRPIFDDRLLFEKIALEGFMAGLSWLTILRKRDDFRRAFHGFDFDVVAAMGEADVETLMADATIVRNRAKIEATVNNARRCLEMAESGTTLTSYIWSYEPVGSHLADIAPEAVTLSRDLKRQGWRFVGPTTLHSMMEAVGMMNNHMAGCSVKPIVEEERSRAGRPGA